MNNQLLTVNLFDNDCRHLIRDGGRYSLFGHPNVLKEPKCIRYVRDQYDWDGITIFTDKYLNADFIDAVNSPIKIGWHLERIYQLLPFNSFASSLDFLMTNDALLLNTYPDKTRFVPFGGGWIQVENHLVHKKSKLLSMIYSSKNTYAGHVLRHKVASEIKGIDLFGSGANNPIYYKEEGLHDYMYTFVIENVSLDNYFTEKLIDPMLTGTIPIYWGCPNIGDFFDVSGMIIVNSFEEMVASMAEVTVENYKLKMGAIAKNLELAKNYDIPEDWVYTNILAGL